ncbi:MAG TPA: MoxR family ATPase [Candidatus Hydrogenedentes bacterium]|nr:MoxR family ATPase [Candidatus Hydrogenedentota bacterium]HOS03435.1 MoxR family ATPase [Candidatus Hydrogenedentota bacterium]
MAEMEVTTKFVQAATPEKVARLVDNIGNVILGKRETVKLCVTGLLARGHILIEDVPGMGKTTLAQGLARSIDCTFSRIQFTSDMLPSDILGVSILNPRHAEFEFRHGPVFANIVLADEINRTPPKTQSALLEAMSEAQVSIDGATHELPRPFLVIATQNPIEYEGTYSLPESQLDRFMIRIDIGYPGAEDELLIMRRRDPRQAMQQLKPVLSVEDVFHLQDQVGLVHVDDSLAEYMLDIVRATRRHEHVLLGASPRASVSLFEACQARALVEGRDYVTPDDVRQMAVPVLSHRILAKARSGDPASSARERSRTILDIVHQLPVPV